MSRGQSWANKQHIPTGEMGENYRCAYHGRDIHICEANRATCYEERREGIETLMRIRDENYRLKNVDAVVFGIEGGKNIQYAVFVESGFLTHMN